MLISMFWCGVVRSIWSLLLGRLLFDSTGWQVGNLPCRPCPFVVLEILRVKEGHVYVNLIIYFSALFISAAVLFLPPPGTLFLPWVKSRTCFGSCLQPIVLSINIMVDNVSGNNY